MRIIALLIGLFAAAPALAQQRIDRAGPVLHSQARAVFPEQVGAFRRANVVSYGPRGDDISASYNLHRDGGRLLITIYIYPATRIAAGPTGGQSADIARAMSCQSEFQSVNRAIEQAHPGPRALAVAPSAPPTGLAPAFSQRSVYLLRTNFDGRMQDLRSEARLYCYVGGEWLVKYRISSSEGMEVVDDIEAFVSQGPWPGRAGSAEPRTIAP